MAIQFLKDNWGKTFFQLVSQTEKHIHIISPFLGYHTAKLLVDHLEEADNPINCVLITKFEREDFISGASNLHALRLLVENGVKVYALQDLHTKLYIFDSHSVITGSANFTFRGFYRNHEFGVLMEQEAAFTAECNLFFEELLTAIQDNGDWLVGIELIEKELKIYDDIIKGRSSKKGQSKNPVIYPRIKTKWGAILEMETVVLPQKDIVEHQLSKKSSGTVLQATTNNWLKFEGNRNKPIKNTLTYIERRKEGFLTETFFPRAPRGIKENQKVFIAQISEDDQRHPVIYIVGYANTFGFQDQNKLDTKSYKGTLPFNVERYPYYIELKDGRFLKGPIKNGIPLNEVAAHMPNRLYPNSKGTLGDAMYAHRQKSHMRITEEAANYIQARLEVLFKEHGLEEI